MYREFRTIYIIWKVLLFNLSSSSSSGCRCCSNVTYGGGDIEWLTGACHVCYLWVCFFHFASKHTTEERRRRERFLLRTHLPRRINKSTQFINCVVIVGRVVRRQKQHQQQWRWRQIRCFVFIIFSQRSALESDKVIYINAKEFRIGFEREAVDEHTHTQRIRSYYCFESQFLLSIFSRSPPLSLSVPLSSLASSAVFAQFRRRHKCHWEYGNCVIGKTTNENIAKRADVERIESTNGKNERENDEKWILHSARNAVELIPFG